MLNGRIAQSVTWLIGKPGSLRFRLARDTLGVMVLKATSMGLGFLISVILARLLGVQEFGLYAFAMSLLGLLSAPAAFGFPQLLVREIAAYRVKGEWSSIRALLRFSQRTALGASLALVLLVGLGLRFFSSRLSPGAEATLGLALVALPLMALIQLQGSALRGFDKILEGQMVNGVLRPLSFLVLIGGVWLVARRFLGATVAVGLQAVAAGITLMVGWLLLRRYVGTQAPETAFSQGNPLWLRSAVWLLFLALLNLIPQHSGVLLLGILRGAEEVALYKAAYQAASLIPFGLMAVNTAIAPTLAQLYAAGERNKLRRIMMAASAAATAFALPLVLLFTVKGAWFLRLTFGQVFATSAIALAIITGGQIINAATGPVGLLLIMSGYENKATLSSSIGGVLNLLLNITLIYLWGINGAAVALAVTLSVTNLFNLYFVLQSL